MALNLRKFIIGTTIVSSIVSSSILPSFAMTHQVVKGDTLWGISKKYNVSLEQIYNLNPHYRNNSFLKVGDKVQVAPIANNTQTYTVQRGDTLSGIAVRFGVKTADLAKANNITNYNLIRVGQRLVIPTSTNTSTNTNTSTTYTVQNNDTPWIISNKFGITVDAFLKANNLSTSQHIYPGQKVVIPSGSTSNPAPSVSTPVAPAPSVSDKTTVTFTTHTVVRGDNLWDIAIKYGVPPLELQKVNGFSNNHVLNIGDNVKIPVYHVPVKATPGAQYGELLDWWTEAQYVVPIGKVFKVVDFHTGKSWMMKRTIGANHADVEPLTANDTAIMKSVWGGNWSWATRPVIIEVDGRKIAASANGMPHDIQYITNNNYNGHSCIHFLNSTRHVDGKINQLHQADILIAAGRK